MAPTIASRADASRPEGSALPVPLGAGNGHRPPAGLAALRPSHTEPPRLGALRPLAVFGRVGQADRLVATCEIAEGLGLAPGLGLAEARARVPELDLVPADPDADDRLLERLADACDRYTPLVAVSGSEALVLDITGCAHLFGDEEGLRADCAARLRHAGFLVRTALSSSPWTALALARHGAAVDAGVRPGGEAEAVAGLPVAALELGEDAHATLRRLGLATLGDLASLPRAALARRFGEAATRRLDEVLGRASRPIRPRRAVPELACERRLFEPVSLREDILRLLDHLAHRLRTGLEERGEGARALELTLFRVDNRVERLLVRTGSPTRDPARVARLFTERLRAPDEELDAGFGYDLVRLAVLGVEPMPAEQGALERGEPAPAEPLDALLDRLGARLGEACVFALEPVASHRPERAQRRAAPAAAPTPAAIPAAISAPATWIGPRPLRLLGRPEPVDATAEVPDGPIRQFRWRRAHYRVARLEGPERIGDEWWREDACGARDYFRVEDEAGRRYWLFREGARPDGASGWFLHGLFA